MTQNSEPFHPTFKPHALINHVCMLIKAHSNIICMQIIHFIRFPLIPGQESILQVLDSSDFPTHPVPPFDGAGLLHVLFRVWVPPPQLAVQTVQSPYSVQPPSTEYTRLQSTDMFNVDQR